jgi:hypothetical protein
LLSQGQTVANVIHNDGGFSGTAANPGVFERTTAWSIFASYEHFWTPSLRTSVYGSYLDISRPDSLNTAMCASGLFGGGSTAAAGRVAGCDLDSNQWLVGSRTQWNITKDLYVGIDFIYHKVNGAQFNAANTATLTAGPLPAKRRAPATPRVISTRSTPRGVSTATSFLDDRMLTARADA